MISPAIPLDQLRWPSLAQDLAVMMVPDSPFTDLQDIYDAYDITPEELKQIITVPKFQQLYEDAQNEFKAQGSNAAQLYRSRQLSTALAEDLFRAAMNHQLGEKESIKLLELLMKASGQFNQDPIQVQNNTQVNVGVNLPLPHGLNNPKIKHLEQE